MNKTKKQCFSWNPTVTTSSLLYEEEISVLLGILSELMSERLGSPTKGDFILMGQRQEGASIEIARCIMDAGHGASTYLGQSCSTEDLAQRAVNCVFAFPHHGYNTTADDVFKKWPTAGIYEDRTGLRALVLNCSNGRFLASVAMPTSPNPTLMLRQKPLLLLHLLSAICAHMTVNCAHRVDRFGIV